MVLTILHNHRMQEGTLHSPFRGITMSRNWHYLTLITAMLMFSGTANATVITSGSNNPLNFSWSQNSAAGLLTGNGAMTISGFSSSSLAISISLANTSALANNRLTAFGFGISPNATSVSFSDANDNRIINASLDNIPSLKSIEVCAFGGPNCSGGGNGGIDGGESDSFSLTLAGTWGDAITIDPVGFKYQTGQGSFEFTTTIITQGCTNGEIRACGTTIPEAPSAWLVLFGFLSIIGMAGMKSRTSI